MARGPTVSTTFNAVDKVTRPAQQMMRSVARVTAVAMTAVSAAGVAGFRAVIREASKIEDATAAFTPLMGGIEKATAMVEALNQTAATTPFQFQDISDAAKQLLPAMNGDIQRTVDTFRMLGDTAGGNAQKLDSITRGYMKSILKGKVDMESLNMIAEAGVPIYSELAASLGVSTQEMMAMSSAGRISADDLTAAFQRMTGQGGIFYQGMEIASQTLSGKMSTLKDNIALTAASIGKSLMPVIKPLVDKAIVLASKVREWVDNNQELIQQKIHETIQKIVKIAKVLWKLWDSGLIPALLAGIVAFKTLYPIVQSVIGVMKIMKTAQIGLNAAMMANPIGLIVAAVAAFIAIAVIAIRHFETWGSALLFIMGPVGQLINLVMHLRRNWDSVKASFAEGGFLAGIETLGRVLIQSVLVPMQQILDIVQRVVQTVSGGRLGGRIGDRLDGLISRNQGVIESSKTTTNNSAVDVNFNNVPPGVGISQRGNAPGLTLNTGYQVHGL